LTRHMNVHVCIADPETGSAVRKLLAASPNMRVTPWRAEQSARHPLARDFGSGVCDGEPFADIDVLLFGSEDLCRFEENEPGRVDELQRRLKVLLLLKSDELPHSLELLRFCDGMIVRDVNLGHITDIIEFALHGYFVIPCNLMTNFKLASAPTRAAIVVEIGSPENGLSTLRGRDLSRDISAEEYCATKTTMRSAIRNVLKRRKNGARAQLDIAEVRRAGDKPDLVPAEENGVRLAGWRRALRDNDGRVFAFEYVVGLAALAIWSAIIILESAGSNMFAKVMDRCPSTASSVQCGVLGKAAKVNSAFSLESAVKDRNGFFKRSVDPDERPE
jgi:hypothetical protein